MGIHDLKEEEKKVVLWRVSLIELLSQGKESRGRLGRAV